jgi:hypothetical protein
VYNVSLNSHNPSHAGHDMLLRSICDGWSCTKPQAAQKCCSPGLPGVEALKLRGKCMQLKACHCPSSHVLWEALAVQQSCVA